MNVKGRESLKAIRKGNINRLVIAHFLKKLLEKRV